MIEEVKIKNFKRFSDETLETHGNIVLAGPNNSGKSTLLQAIAVWNLALTKWLAERGRGSGSTAKKRTGVPITRKDFTAIPLREMKLLWTDCSTSLHKDELAGEQKLGTNRVMEISISATTASGSWTLPFQFTYQSPELVYAKPSPAGVEDRVMDAARELGVVHVPPFSGIGAEETRIDRPYQDLLVGQGKSGEIIRNLLLEICEQKSKDRWDKLRADIKDIFSYELLDPQYGGPFILCQYRPDKSVLTLGRSTPPLDISSAGSGFLQVLMLLGFFYARPATVLLLDEPDAHLHVILQSQIYDRLREVAAEQKAQLMIATHSEVLIENTSPGSILSFYQRPHRLMQETQRDTVREALRRLTSMEVVRADQSPAILYTEDESDLKILREWAVLLGHPVQSFLDEPFVNPIRGRNPREAKAHFFALSAIKPDMRGVLLLHGDNRSLLDHDVTDEGLVVLRWKRYEIESYLINAAVLERFLRQRVEPLFVSSAMEFLGNELPPAVLRDPMSDHEFLDRLPASKTLLPAFFDKTGLNLSKKEYYLVAREMRRDELLSEIQQKLDVIRSVVNPGAG